MDDQRLFRRGIKRALLCNSRWIEGLEDYVYVQRADGDFSIHVFFHSDEEKEQFLLDEGAIDDSYLFDDRALGLWLGYPPVAVEDFVDLRWSGIERASIKCSGIQFALKEENIEEAVDWLLWTYEELLDEGEKLRLKIPMDKGEDRRLVLSWSGGKESIRKQVQEFCEECRNEGVAVNKAFNSLM